MSVKLVPPRSLDRSFYTGLSTDVKPSGVETGALFYELDSRRWYVFDGSSWSTYAGLADPAKVLFDNDFSDGLQGWSGLRTTGKNFYPSLSPVSLVGPHAMILDCTDDLSAPATPVAACKRLYAHEGLIRWTSYFAWNATNSVNDLAKLRWIIDWQRGQTRRWLEVRYRHYDEATSSQVAAWEVNNGNSAGTYTAVSSYAGYLLGMNATNKTDYHKIEIVADPSGPAWVSLQLDSLPIVDLSGIAINATTAAETDFENGSNFLFWIEDRTNTSSADPWMLVDRTRAEVYK